MKLYYVIMTYPSGKVEELQEGFEQCEAAKAYGIQLLNQIPHNENYRSPSFLEEEKQIKPFFVVVEKDDKESKIVYDSLKDKKLKRR